MTSDPMEQPLPSTMRLNAVRSDTYDTFLQFLEALLTPYNPSDTKEYEKACRKYAGKPDAHNTGAESNTKPGREKQGAQVSPSISQKNLTQTKSRRKALMH